MTVRLKNSTVNFAHGTTYLLAEGGTVIIRLNSGYAETYNADEVSLTRLTVWCPTGNVYVTENGGGVIPITPEIPVPTRGPYQEGAERRTVVEYAGQPGAYPVETDVHLQGRPWAYSDEVVYFKVELLRDDGTVYADNGFDVGGKRVYPHVQLRLCTSAGREEQPDGADNFKARALSAKTVLLAWNTPVEATSTAIYYNTTGEDGAQTLLTDAGPVGEDAWYIHEGLTPGTQYYYFLKCSNEEGDSGDAVYVGTVKTPVLPALPDAPEITSVVTPNAVSAMLTFEPSAEAVLPDGTTAPNTYRVYGRIASTPDLPGNYVVINVPGDATSASVDWLFPATDYVVYMTAVNAAGESAATATQTFTTPAAPGNPPTPTDVDVDTLGPNSQTVSWDVSNEDIVGFGLYYSTDLNTWTAVQDFGPLPATARSWTQTGLAQNTTYYWRVFAFNYVDGVLTKGTPAQASAATNPAPEQPDAVTAVSGVSYTNTTIAVTWTPGANASDGTVKAYKVYRSTDDSTYVLKGTIPPNVTYFVDRGLTPNTLYYYRVDAVGYGGDVTGATGNCTTLHSSGSMFPVCGFDLHPDSRNRIVEVAGRAFITSDRDRWVVRYGDSWFKAGIRPIRGATGLAAAAGGVLDAGTYGVYLVLRRGETRSIPLFLSTAVTIGESDTDKTLVVTPPTNTAGDKVECRDIGYDVNGNVIDGAEFWEIYVGETAHGDAYRVAELPLTVADWEDSVGSGTYTIDATLTTAAIFDGTRRPLEKQLESSLPPACWELAVKDNRLMATGEVDLKPTTAEVTAGAKLTITAGNKYFEVSDWDASDGCLYHRLELNGIDTGWEVYDYDHDVSEPLKVTKCYIRHSDPAVEAGGFAGATGDYTDFALLGTASRVYLSAFFSGNAGAGIVYSPETFPPLTVAETEFFPDDNGEVLSLVASGESVLAGKPEKWISVTGGDEIDIPVLGTRAISRGSGVNAIYSPAQDTNGYVYYLGDTGVFRVSQGGVEKVNVRLGCRRMFSEVFDMSSVPNGKGAWFSREDWYVVVGLNRAGAVGNRDGFILDTANGALLPFTMPYEITHIREYKSSAGEFQLLFGADGGKMGYLFKAGLYVDNVDYTGTYALAGAVPIKTSVTSGVVDTDQALTMRWVQPRVKSKPRSAKFEFRLEVDDKTRCDDADEFVMADYVEFDTDVSGDHVSMSGGRYEQVQFRLTAQTRTDLPGARFEIRELPMRMVVRHAS